MGHGGVENNVRRFRAGRAVFLSFGLLVAMLAGAQPAAAQADFACAVTVDQNSVVVAWTDIGARGYDVIEDDQPKRWVRGTESTDRSPGLEYTVVAWGNGTNGTTSSCTNPNPSDPDQPGPEPFSCSVTGDAQQVVVSWIDIGANGYDLIEDDNAKIWVRATSYVDNTPGGTYRLVAWGNGTDRTAASCTAPDGGNPPPPPPPPPEPGFSCTVEGDQQTVTVSWTDIGANGYDVIEDDQPKRWVRTTAITDTTPAITYKIVAFGNGTNWTTAICANPDPPDPGDPGNNGYPNPGNPAGDGTIRLLAAGDIAVCGNTAHHAVGAYVESRTDALFMALGDIAYPDGSPSDFANCYDPHFGDAKARTLPVVGNHEYYTASATGYIDYFGAAAGPSDKLYYSVDIDDWHIVVLNGDCWRVGGCGTDGPQYQWLQQDLAANNRPCILTAWHQAYFTSESTSGDYTNMRDYYALLDAEGADILLTGHAHNYERFHRMDADGAVTSSGIRPFVIGTGGTDLRPFAFIHNGSAVRDNTSHGVLEFRLGPTSYTWDFVATSGSLADSGYGTCG